MNPTNTDQNLQSKVYQFDNCYLDTIERRAFKDGNLLEITPKAFDLLLFLIENPGEVITKTDILTEVWGESFVEESNMAVQISRLRKLIDPAKEKPFIETVSGVGYRFISRVYEIGEDVWAEIQAKMNQKITDDEDKDGFDSIAILPLRNENGEEEVEYLADGLTESLINNLSFIPDLRVLARNTVFRFKNKDVDIQEIGQKLGVETILTGRIRVIQNKLSIAIELTKVSDGTQIWGTHLNQPFEDVLEMQKTLTREISEKLKTQLDIAKKNLAIQQITQNTESYRLYLKGKYLFNKKTIKDINKAVDCFQQSISHDPTNAHSYIELANCIKQLIMYEKVAYQDSLSQIVSLLEKATKLNPFIPELNLLKGIVKIYFEFDIQGAKKFYKSALKLNPNLVSARYRYSMLLIYCHQFSEAFKQSGEITRIDPFSLEGNKSMARVFFVMEQYQHAIIKLNECLELEPEDFEIHLLLGSNLVELGKFDQSLQAFQKSLELQYHVETISMIGYASAKAGKIKEAEMIIKDLKEKAKSENVSPIYFAFIYSALGKIDKTFEYLDKGLKQHNLDLISLKCDTRFKSIRTDLRFNKLLRKIGLPVD